MDPQRSYRRHPLWRAPAAGRFPTRIWAAAGPRGVDLRGPGSRRPGGLCLSVRGQGSGGGLREGGPRAGWEAAALAGQARAGPGGRGAGARAAGWRGGGLTSPGTAPSTPSRYSGTARAAAGRCWRRGRCRRPSANRCTGCTPAPRRAG